MSSVTQLGDEFTVTFNNPQPFGGLTATYTAGGTVYVGMDDGTDTLGAPIGAVAVLSGNTSPWDGVTLFQSSTYLTGLATTTVNGNTVGSATLMPADVEWQGPVTLNGNTTFDVGAGARLIIDGPVDDATNPLATGSDVILVNTGEVDLLDANTYRGNTYLGTSAAPGSPGYDPYGVNEFFQGPAGGALPNPDGSTLGTVLTVGNSEALGAAGSNVVIQGGSSIQLLGATAIAGKTLYLNGTGLSSVGSTAPETWFEQGPAPITSGPTVGSTAVSGRMTGIAVAPNDPNTIYVATAGGGVWKTVNHGASWVQIFDNANTSDPEVPLYTGAIAIDPTNPNVVYVGTGEADNSLDSYYGTGVYRSANGGQSWTQLIDATGTDNTTGQFIPNPSNFESVSSILVDPTNSNDIYIAINDFYVANGKTLGAGVWRYNLITKTWFDLTGWVSVFRNGVKGPPTLTGGFPKPTSAPGTPGPDDDWNITFPQGAATGPKGHVSSGSDCDYTDLGYSTASGIGMLYMSLGSPGNGTDAGYAPTQDAAFLDFEPVVVENAVYRCINPATATSANTYGPGGRPVWYVGDGDLTNDATNPPYFWTPADGEKYDTGGNKLYPVGEGGSLKFTIIPGTDTIYAIDAVQYNEFAPTEPGAPLLDIQESTDGGATWFGSNGNNAPVVPPATNQGNFPGTQGWYDLTITGYVNPLSDEIQLFVGGEDLGIDGPSGNDKNFIWWSDDGAASAGGWKDISQEGGIGPETNEHASAFNVLGNVYMASDGGIYEFSPSTVSWTDLNSNLATSLMNSVATDPLDPNVEVAGAENNGTSQFAVSSVLANNTVVEQWTLANSNVKNDTNFITVNDTEFVDDNGGMVRIDPNNPANVYAVLDGTLYMSTTGGTPGSFTSLGFAPGNNVPNNPGGNFPPAGNFPIAIDQIDSDRVLAGGGAGLFESDEQGANGTFNFIGPVDKAGNPIPITAFGISTYQGAYEPDKNFPLVGDGGANNYDPGTIYATDGANIYVTKNDGGSWVTLDNGLPTTAKGVLELNISSIAVDPRDRDNVYLTASNVLGSSFGYVYQLTYFPATETYKWEEIGGSGSDGLPLVPTYSVVVDPHTGDVFVGTDLGVYELPANTSKWVPFGTGLPQVSVRDMTIDPTSNTVTIATYGRGVYQVLLNDTEANAGALTALTGTGQWNGPVVLTDATTLSAQGSETGFINNYAAQLTIQGAISDESTPNNLNVGFLSGSATINSGLGTVIFEGANNYFGPTTIASGVLVADNLTALGSPFKTTDTTVTGGLGDLNSTALELESSVDSGGTLVLNGDGPLPAYNGHNTGALESKSNDVTYLGPILLNTANVTIGVDSGSTLTLLGAITDGGIGANLTKELTGTLILNESALNADTYGGSTYVYQGALQIGSAYALPGGSATTVLDGAQLQLAGSVAVPSSITLNLSGTGINGTGALLNVNGDNTFEGTIFLNADPGFSATTYPVGTVSFAAGYDGAVFDPSNILNITGPIDEATSVIPGGYLYSGITKVGPDTLVFGVPPSPETPPTDSYHGTTFVENGYVSLQNPKALGDDSASDPLANDPIQRLTGVDPAQTGSFTLSLTVGGVTATSASMSTAGGAGVGVLVQTQLRTKILPALVKAGVLPAGVSANVGADTFTITNTSILEFVLTVVFTGMPAGLVLPQLVALATNGATVIETNVADNGYGTEVLDNATNGTAGALQLDFGTAGNTVTGETLLLNGTGPTGTGAMENLTGNNRWNGQITLGTTTDTGSNPLGSQDDAIGVDAAESIVSATEAVQTIPIANISESANVVAVATLNPLYLTQGQQVVIAGVATAGYNGTFVVTSVSGTSFTYSDDNSGLAPDTTGTVAINTVTVTTATPLVSAAGQQVSVSGVVTPGYNGIYLATGASGDTFTYTDPNGGLVAESTGNAATTGPATGTANLTTLSLAGNVAGTSSASLDKIGVGTLNLTHANTYAGTTNVEVGYLRASNNLALGGPVTDDVQTITVSGALTGNYTLTYTDASGNTNTSGTIPVDYTNPATLAALQAALDSITGAGNTIAQQTVASETIADATEAGNTVTITTTPAALGLVVGQQVVISGVGTFGYNGTFTVTAVSGLTFQYTDGTLNLGNDSTGGTASTPSATYTVTFIGALAGQPQQPLATNGSVSSGSEVDIATVTDGGQGNTIVTAGATLQVANGIRISTEQVVLNGNGVIGSVGLPVGALEGTIGAEFWDPNTVTVSPDPVPPDSSIILETNSSIGVDAGGVFTVDQDVTETPLGSGQQLTKVGTGTLIFSGTTSNTYSGLTTVANGTLEMDKAPVVAPLDTIAAWNGSGEGVVPFGVPNTATYGQTITATAGESLLSSFSFEMDLPSAVVFRGEVYAWNGTEAVGPDLYESAPTSTDGSGTFQLITFNIPNGVALTVGQQYVLFASTAKDQAGVTPGTAGSWGLVPTDPYTAGNFVYLNDGPDGGAGWTTSAWGSFGAYDLAFHVTFGATDIPANLTVGDGVGAPLSAIAQMEAPDQFSNTATVTVNSDGLFDDNGVGSVGNDTVIGTLIINDGTVATDASPAPAGGAGGALYLGVGGSGTTMTGGTITTNTGGTVQLNGAVTATSDSLGEAKITGTGTFNVDDQLFDVTQGPQAADLDITLPIADSLDFVKTGTGTLELDANSTGAAFGGAPNVLQGELQVNGAINNVILDGGTLSGTSQVGKSGTGQVGDIVGPSSAIPQGTIDPGDNGDTTPLTTTGILTTNTGAGETWGPGTVFAPDLLDGTNSHGTHLTAGVDYDQLLVNGNLNLGGALLSSTLPIGTNVAIGDQFIILQETGSGVISGAFSDPYGLDIVTGLPIVYISGAKFDVSYLNSSNVPDIGNATSVVLTRVLENASLVMTSAPPASAGVTTSVYGQDVVFTGTMVAEAGAGLVPSSDSVSFNVYAGATATGTPIATESVNLNGSDQATFDPQSVAVGDFTVPVGTHAVTVSFNGDPNFNTPPTYTLSWVVNPASSAINLTNPADPANTTITSVYGQTVNILATVTPVNPGGQTPLVAPPSSSGGVQNVTFLIDPGTLNFFTVPGSLDTSGHATLSIGTLTFGTHHIQAEYGNPPFPGGFGDINYLSSVTTSSFVVVVDKDSSSVTPSSSPTTSQTVGQPVTFIATINTTSPGTATPAASDKVTFLDGTSVLGTGFVTFNAVANAYQATFTTSANQLAVGTHQIFMNFSGDNLLNASSAPALTYVVNQVQTFTALTSSVNPSAVNQQVTFTATVTSNTTVSGTPIAGSVAFYNGATLLGTGSGINASGQSFFQISTLLLGPHNITAVYAQTQDYTTSTSAILQQVVDYSTLTSLSAAPNPQTYNQNVNLTAAVTSTTGTPTGTVNFYADGSATPLNSTPVTLTGGMGTFATSSLATPLTVGNHTIEAVYTAPGGSSYESGSSQFVTLVIESATTTTLTSSAPTAGLGNWVSLDATVAATSPGASTAYGGTVTFTDFFNGATTTLASNVPVNSATGVAALSTSGLALGTHAITATYSGSASSFNAPGNPVTIAQIISYADTVTVVSAQNPSPFGTGVMFTATVLPSSVTTPITAASETGTQVTITAANAFADGQQVTIAGILPAGYDGTFTLTSASATQFTYSGPAHLAAAVLGSARSPPRRKAAPR